MTMERKDWLMLLLGLPDADGGTPAVDRVRAMKCLFVLGQRYPQATADGFYSFQPYNFGPFDADVYNDAEMLVAHGLAEQHEGQYVSYSATPQGVQKAREIAQNAPNEATKWLLDMRAWANRVDFSTLVKAIYQEWPDQKVNSIFRD